MLSHIIQCLPGDSEQCDLYIRVEGARIACGGERRRHFVFLGEGVCCVLYRLGQKSLKQCLRGCRINGLPGFSETRSRQSAAAR